PAAEVAQAAVEGDLAAGEDADAERVARARIQHGDVLHALLVEQPAQLGVDLARGEILGLEHRLVAVDLGDLRDGVVELDEPSRVEQDLGLGGAHRLHTITSLSYGS